MPTHNTQADDTILLQFLKVWQLEQFQTVTLTRHPGYVPAESIRVSYTRTTTKGVKTEYLQ